MIAEHPMFVDHTNAKPDLLEGFEFLPVKRNIIINKEKSDKKQYISLLLEKIFL